MKKEIKVTKSLIKSQSGTGVKFTGKVLVEKGELYKDENGVVQESIGFSHDDPRRIQDGEIISVRKGAGGEVVDASEIVSASYDQVKAGDRKDTPKEKVMRFKPREANDILQSTGLSWFKTKKTLSPSALIKEAQEQTDKHASKFNKQYADDEYGKNSREANLQQLAQLPDTEAIFDIVFDAQELKKQHSGFSFTETVKAQSGGIPESMDGLNEYPNQPVVVPSGDITMDGIDYPVEAYDAQSGEYLETMQPDQQYNFNAEKILEIPKAQSGGRGKVVLKTASRAGYTYEFDESKVKDNMIPYTDRSGKKSLMHINEYSKLKAQPFNASPATTVPQTATGSNAMGVGMYEGNPNTVFADQDGTLKDPEGNDWFVENGRYQMNPAGSRRAVPFNPLKPVFSGRPTPDRGTPSSSADFDMTRSAPAQTPVYTGMSWNAMLGPDGQQTVPAREATQPAVSTSEDNFIPNYGGNTPAGTPVTPVANTPGNTSSPSSNTASSARRGSGRPDWDTGNYRTANQNGSSYIVGKGDWLSSIAAANGVTTDKLVAANPQLKDINKLTPGETLNIPSVAPDDNNEMKLLDTIQRRSVPGTPAIPTVQEIDKNSFIGPPDYEGSHDDSNVVANTVKGAADVAGTLLGRVNRDQSTFGLRAQMAASRNVEPAYRTEVPYRTVNYQEQDATPYIDEIDTAVNQQLQYVNPNTSQGQAILNNIRNSALGNKRQIINRVNAENLQRRSQTDNMNVQLLNQSDMQQQQANKQYVTETQQNLAAQDAAKIAVGQQMDALVDNRTRTDNALLYTSMKYPNFRYDPKTGEIRQINPEINDPTKKPKAKFGGKKS